jgi:hypothetical protein
VKLRDDRELLVTVQGSGVGETCTRT